MSRKNFIKVVKCFSFWKIDKRRGNYSLPSGNKLDIYLTNLVCNLLRDNKLTISSNGDIFYSENQKIMIPFGKCEELDNTDQFNRIRILVNEII